MAPTFNHLCRSIEAHASGFGFRVYGLFVRGLGFRVLGFREFRVWDLGLRFGFSGLKVQECCLVGQLGVFVLSHSGLLRLSR